VTRRRNITQGIIDLLPGAGKLDLDQAVHTWYMNIRDNGGFRLTDLGYLALNAANINFWAVTIDPKAIGKRELLIMDRNLLWPYYIDNRNRKLILFSSKEAVMASLYGNVKQWLMNLGSQ
jgi:hypothetical protein